MHTGKSLYDRWLVFAEVGGDAFEDLDETGQLGWNRMATWLNDKVEDVTEHKVEDHSNCYKDRVATPGIPACVCCGREVNLPHLLGCHFVRSHYDMVLPKQCMMKK